MRGWAGGHLLSAEVTLAIIDGGASTHPKHSASLLHLVRVVSSLDQRLRLV